MPEHRNRGPTEPEGLPSLSREEDAGQCSQQQTKAKQGKKDHAEPVVSCVWSNGRKVRCRTVAGRGPPLVHPCRYLPETLRTSVKQSLCDKPVPDGGREIKPPPRGASARSADGWLTVPPHKWLRHMEHYGGMTR